MKMRQSQVYQGSDSVTNTVSFRKGPAVKGTKIGIGLIGAGGMGRLVAQKVLAQDPRLEIRGVFDPDRRSVEATLNSLAPQAVVFKDYRKLCESPDIDWVMIASWNCSIPTATAPFPSAACISLAPKGRSAAFPTVPSRWRASGSAKRSGR